MNIRTGPVSEREAEVHAALGEHLSNAEIAHRLFISVRTVESHVSALLRKYGVSDRRALAALAPRPHEPAPAPGRLGGFPAARTTFVGREQERAVILDALQDDRLVTLVGPGGVGKTRLAVVSAEAAAAGFPFGGAFVDLVPARDGFVGQAVAAALGVVPRAQESPADAVVERLRRGRSLLVLDNCEHLVAEAAAFAERVLSACPGTTVLATSRERLGVPGERIVPVAPLPLESDAVVLFRDRAGAVDPGFSADVDIVARLCTRLDGVPLAIELAAARSGSLGAADLLAGLDDALRLLAGGRGHDERHRSLRAVIDWSYLLLDDDEREVFRRLAVFVGGFDLDAVTAVAAPGRRAAAADVLGRLVDKNLVARRRAGGWRLLETVRAFAAELLERSDEHGVVRRRHLVWAAATAAELEGRADGWAARFAAAADDLRSALVGAPADAGAPAHALARSLGRLCFARRFLVESLAHFRVAAARAPSAAEAVVDLRAAAGTAHVATASPLAFQLLIEAAERARDAGDGAAQAIAQARVVELADRFHTFFDTGTPPERLSALLADATVAAGPHPTPTVRACLAVAAAWNAGVERMTPDPGLATVALLLARESGDALVLSAALDAVISVAAHAGRLREANRLSGERLAVQATLDRYEPTAAPEIEDAFYVGAVCAIAAGDLPAAVRIASQVRDDDLVGEHPYLSASNLVPALVLSGDLDEALRSATTMWKFWDRAGRPGAAWMASVVAFAALGWGLHGDHAGFQRWRARVDEVASASTASASRNQAPAAAFADARYAVHTGDLGRAAELVERASADHRHSHYWPYALAAGAELAVVAGLPDAADRLAVAARAAAENDWAAAALARATGRLRGDRSALIDAAAGWERIGARSEHTATLALLQ
ncbi:ATP-binding protein [Pseudonocardia xinjiangensis]|uniref:ATP-binding protein n=1 Tax=Pseudonocardia xinjiangensis TaxID=75289 RepID=UPI003D8AA603